MAIAVATTGCTPSGPTDPDPTTSSTSSTTVPVADHGRVLGWGYNGFGNLGDGTLSNQPSPVALQLPDGVDATAVAAGGFHTLAIGTDGVTYAVGRDDNGELGDDPAFAYRVTPVPVASPPGVRFLAVSAGGNHSLAIGDDGNTYAWGLDAQGQLGDGPGLGNQPTPVRVATPPGVHFVSVSAGFAHSLAIGDDGNTYAWGYDHYSELGDDAAHVDQPAPVRVATPPGVVFTEVAAGGHHNLAIASDGSTYAWGWNAYGQLGDATTSDRDLPTAVSGPTGLRRVAAGAHHSLGIGADGRVLAWGSDEEGELGDDAALASRSVPTPSALGITVRRIAAGGRHSVAVDEHGGLHVWGSDDEGEMGDGPPSSGHPTPVAVALPGGASAIDISAGYYHAVAIAVP